MIEIMDAVVRLLLMHARDRLKRLPARMKTHRINDMLALSVASSLAAGQWSSAQNAVQSDLESLREKRARLVDEAVGAVDAGYLRSLAILLEKAIQAGDLDGAVLFKDEIERVRALPAAQGKAAPAEKQPDPAPDAAGVDSAALLWVYLADTTWTLSSPDKAGASRHVFFGRDGIAVYDNGRRKGRWWCTGERGFHIFTVNDVGIFAADLSSFEITYADGSKSTGKPAR